MSRKCIWAKFSISVRYMCTHRRAAVRMPLASKPLSRAATTTLAARRFTSQSKEAGSVSSKSFTSKTSRRSRAAYMPKLSRCASPQHCTRMSVVGRCARSHAIGAAAPR
jgi:hypothetical protein